MSSTVAQGRERVPVEHRVLGLDRRSFPYALTVLGVFLVATVVIPRIDDAIEWDDPVRAGEQLALTDAIAFTPTTGWEVETGFRVGEGGSAAESGAAVVVGEGVVLEITPDDFDGTPAELIGQVEKVTTSTTDPTFRADSPTDTVTTTAGDVGVIQTYSSVRGDGVVAAFVIDGTGLEVTAYGPPTQMRAAAGDITDMIASIRAEGDGA
jgi:hypothetical protein